MTQADGTLLVSVQNGVAQATFNRPEAINAFNDAQRTAFRETMLALAADPAVRVIVIGGAGDRGFSAGADVKAELYQTRVDAHTSPSPKSSRTPKRATISIRCSALAQMTNRAKRVSAATSKSKRRRARARMPRTMQRQLPCSSRNTKRALFYTSSVKL